MSNSIKIHHACSIDVSGLMLEDGVASVRLERHIRDMEAKYPSRALFVDGKCVHPGALGEKEVAHREVRLRSIRVLPLRDTTLQHTG